MSENIELKRTLTFPKLFFFTIISVLDAGIFLLPFIAYSQVGNTSIFGWALAGLFAMALSIVFSELAYNYPSSGGLYEYTKQAFGVLPSFIVGWSSFLAATITISMLLVGAIKFLNPNLPNSITIIISILFIFFISLLTIRGLDESIIMVLSFGALTIFSLAYLTIKTFSLPSILEFISTLNFELKATLLSAFLVFETFMGLEGATYLAEETKNPRETLPKAMFFGMLTINLIILLFVLSSLSYGQNMGILNELNPLQKIIEINVGIAESKFFTVLIYLSIIGSASSLIITTPRLVYSIARDKLLPPEFIEIDEKYRTPKNAIILTMISSILVLIFSATSFESLLHILMPIGLTIYTIVLISYYKLKLEGKIKPLKITIPLYKISVPILILINISFILAWIFSEMETTFFIRTVLIMILFAIPIWISINLYYNPDAVVGLTTLFSWLNYKLEDYLLPKKIRKEILSYFDSWQDLKVIEYGSGVGTLTLMLAYEVGKKGEVYAIDVNEKNLAILRKRLKKLGIKNIHTLHDPHMFSRLYPEIKYADAIVSIGSLSYIQDLDKILSRLSKILPENGRILFIDYVDVFKIFPNPPRLKDHKKLKEKFEKYGFYINIHKKRGLFWNYLVIYGIKSKEPVSFI